MELKSEAKARLNLG